jgi:hypothetical protein
VLREEHALCTFRIICAIEEHELHGIRMFAVKGEVHAPSVPLSPEGIRLTGPDPHISGSFL